MEKDYQDMKQAVRDMDRKMSCTDHYVSSCLVGSGGLGWVVGATGGGSGGGSLSLIVHA